MRADMGLDGRFLRQLTHTTCASEPTQQTAPWGMAYAAHARLGRTSLAAQRRAGPGVKVGGQGMDGISSIAYQMHFSSMIGSERYWWEARHRVDERKGGKCQCCTRSVRVR